MEKTKRAVTMVRLPLDMANYKITNDGIVDRALHARIPASNTYPLVGGVEAN